MLSWKIRKKLIILLTILVFVNGLLYFAPDPSNAREREVLEQADLLMKQQKYSEALELLKRTMDFHTEGDVKPLEERITVAQAMEASDRAFSTAMDYYNQGEFAKALTYFRQVNPKDVKNYTDARQRICELDMSIVRDVIQEKKDAEVQ